MSKGCKEWQQWTGWARRHGLSVNHLLLRRYRFFRQHIFPLWHVRGHKHTHFNNLWYSTSFISSICLLSLCNLTFLAGFPAVCGCAATRVFLKTCEHMHIDGFEKKMWCQISTWPSRQLSCSSSLLPFFTRCPWPLLILFIWEDEDIHQPQWPYELSWIHGL